MMASGLTQKTMTVDPVTLQVMTNAIYSIADEMMAALVRTSFSTNIKDRRDCSGAIFTPDCELVAQGEIGTPLHLGVMLPTVRGALKEFPENSIEPGDDILINTPYPEGPGHLNDMTLISPVFHEEELVGYVANMAHHVDVGGFAPGSMPFGVWEHYQEGLQVPPIKIRKKGKLDEELIRLISKNLRTPIEFRGDLTAQIAANNVAKTRLGSLMDKWGRETVLFYEKELMNYSERRITEAIRRLPSGSHTFEDYLEGDGISNERITVRVRVTIEDAGITADFRDSDPQVAGPLNCRLPSVQACVYYVAKVLLDPGLPPNSGAFRPIKILTRPGSLLEVQHPGTLCNANIITTQRIVDALLGAFLQVVAERVCAACSGTMNLLNIGGTDPRTGLLFNYIETYGGGQGALFDRDGASAVHNHMSNTRNAPVEVIESTYPFFIRRYELVPESAGHGKFRGGFGMMREIQVESDHTTLTVSSDRFEIPPWGNFGGLPARQGNCTIVDPRGREEKLSSKITRPIQKGSRLRSMTPGGGGWGNPYQRDPERVRQDVSQGLISARTAERVYGVVLRQDLTVDWDATRARRRKEI